MPDLALEFEWVDPGGARGPELRATWARLEMIAAGEVVTRVLDQQTRSVRDGLYLPLYPIAEWIASNWWRLLYEVPSPHLTDGNGYGSRHCLAEAGEGFALPALSLEPQGESLRLSWSGRKPPQAPLEFLGSGVSFLKREAVQAGLTEFVDAVVGRLDEEGVEGTFLQEEWRAIRTLEPDEEEFCRLAATLGLDPFQVPQDLADQVIQAAEKVPLGVQEEFFASADLTGLVEEAAALRETVDAARAPHEGLEPLRELRAEFRASERAGDSSVHLPRLPPWKQGYAAAQVLRVDLGLDGRPLPSFGSLAGALGVECRALEGEIRTARGLVTVDGIVALDHEERPGFAVKSAVEPARRFTFCRELFEYLAAPGTAPAIVTRGATHRQRRNRAFAAEFLLPSAALRNRFPDGCATLEEANQVAGEFAVSWAVLNHQLENHRIAEIIPS
jgi:hypothetical protein